MFSGKTIIVTGGTGFIGSHLVRRLVHEGADVHSVQRSSDTKRLTDVLSAVQFHSVDLTDEYAVIKLFQTLKPHGVFHLAALNQSYGVVPKPSELMSANTLATINVIQALEDHPYDFFVNTGTFTEVGPKTTPLSEAAVCEPTEMYSISKLSSTLFSQAHAKAKQKPIVTLRVFTPYGPYMQPGKIITQLIEGALTGKEIKLSSKNVTRDFIYIDDLLDLYLRAAEAGATVGSEIFNAGTGVATELGVLVTMVEACTNTKIPALWSEDLATYDRSLWQADLSKVKRLLSWEPKVPLDSGLKQTFDWFATNQNLWK